MSVFLKVEQLLNFAAIIPGRALGLNGFSPCTSIGYFVPQFANLNLWNNLIDRSCVFGYNFLVPIWWNKEERDKWTLTTY